MDKIRAAAYAGLRRGRRQSGIVEKKKKKAKPRPLSEAELLKLRRVLAQQKASEALY